MTGEEATTPLARRASPEGTVIGLSIMALGAILLLDRLGFIPHHRHLTFWPFLMITGGLLSLLKVHKDGRRHGGWWVFIGVWLLLNDVGILQYGSSWPLFLVAIGASLVWKALFPYAPRADLKSE